MLNALWRRWRRPQPQAKLPTPRQVMVFLFQGVAIGTAEIIPGVSGSTIALLLGIYDDFIELLYQGSELVKVGALWIIRRRTWQQVCDQFLAIRWQFGIILGLGMITAVIGLSSLITVILLQFPQYLLAFLLGLLPPTIVVVYHQLESVSKREIIIAAGTTAVLLGLFVLSGTGANITNPHPLHVFIGGMVAISTMVLPGVSGSFMLLVLGLYNWAVGLIASFSQGTATNQDLMLLLTLLAGVGTGFLTTVRLLRYAFKEHRNTLMAFLLGLLTASWYVLWPFVKVVGFDHEAPVLEKVLPWHVPIKESFLLSMIVIITSVVVYTLHNWADRQDTHSPTADDGFDRL